MYEPLKSQWELSVDVSVLLIDGDLNYCRTCGYALATAGFKILTAGSPREGLNLFQPHYPAVVVTDLMMPERNSFKLLADIHARAPNTPIIVVTGHGSIENAVNVMKAGAFDYLLKPIPHDLLIQTLRRALNFFQNKKVRYPTTNPAKAEERVIIGQSPVIQILLQRVTKIANSDVSVLLQGESGTGKELIARQIHQQSARREAPFVAVNCAAIPENLFESELFGYRRGAFTGASRDKTGKLEIADGGTLFLDEIGELPLALQPKLLRALQEQEIEPVGGSSLGINVRVIAATNRDLEKDVAAGYFRDDLYFRLAVVPLNMPPLRSRPEDIPLLIKFYLQQKQATNVQLSAALLKALQNYNWPGNVRELANLLEQMLVFRRTNLLDIEDLPERIRAGFAHYYTSFKLPIDGISLEELEHDLILQALHRCRWNKTQAAESLHITRHALQYRLIKYSLKNPRN